jgi:hypothetical protein
MYNRQYVIKDDDNFKGPIKPSIIDITPFGEEVGSDEIYWWVFKKENDINELYEKTNNLLSSAQKLKEDSLLLKNKSVPKSYKELVLIIKEFADQHIREIEALYEYVVWLSCKDILAPAILFTYRVWGSTRRSDRMTSIKADSVKNDESTVKMCTQLVLGLQTRFGPTINMIYGDMASKIADSVDPEEWTTFGFLVDRDSLLRRTSNHALSELATYFEFIRQSLRNIMIEIERYKTETRLMYDESFWTRFIIKAMSRERVETDLWDFKNTLEMWYCQYEKKNDFETEFSEDVASYANSKGGVLIIGITDKFPRKVIGVDNIEEKINSIPSILNRYLQSNIPIHFQQVRLKNETGNDYDCLLIAIAQTKKAIEVRNQKGWSSYPVRIGAGKTKGNLDEISQSKLRINHDNYDFIPSSIYTFVGSN